ncbi:DinB family protein [Pedobacter sp. ISL-68]|uniref:DinB family protein n=1 Tax=unclassified Pedobacter TaxID=2628915 RepID=UPI001BEB3AC2|nr:MULTISPECIES: DinB family protein [unclassified Pedobacter]MBT2563945.1 DinB family protein [Pedobacter sp. ISL-64]MBT2592648.1 DinB family protein [Pedobacter sp. ISL-68]
MSNTLATIAQVKNTRIFILELVKDLSIEQLNKIPAGFNNNIIWNIAHLTAAQQNMCYVRSGLEITVEEKYFSPFLSGTKPDKFIEKQEINSIFDALLNSMDRLATDYSNGVFLKFDPWDKRYGMKLNSIADAINFVPFHEGMHIGYIMALKKLV